MDLLTTEFSVAQWLEHSTSVYGRSWVQFPSGTQIFSCSSLHTYHFIYYSYNLRLFNL